jgi:hypothetical protein
MFFVRGMWWCSGLRHCATSRKTVRSIPDGVIGVFYWHIPSSRTMALGLTQPLTEMSTRNISCGVKSVSVCRADNLTTFMSRMSWNLGASNSWNAQGLSRLVMGLLYFLTFPLWLWGTGSINIQAPGPSFLGTGQFCQHLHQQDTALRSKCWVNSCLSQLWVAQKIRKQLRCKIHYGAHPTVLHSLSTLHTNLILTCNG